ncbi:MAG: hypothetical protein AB7D07_16700 [Desulfovibrionaceae bacterium]
MKIIFHSYQLGLRGTEIALYDYAFHGRSVLNAESVILTKSNAPGHRDEAIEKFSRQFPVLYYEAPEDIDRVVEKEKADAIYLIKGGENDGLVSKSAKTLVHAVFRRCEPHGDVYAYISRWLSAYMTEGRAPWVPHMIDLPQVDEDLRDELGIPRDAVVFGRYGGMGTFDVKAAHKAVYRAAARRKNAWFLFMNTDQLRKPFLARDNQRIVHIPGTADMKRKVAFINTCDAMLHARRGGETFGLAVGEFSARNKPVITYALSEEQAHLDILQDKALRFSTYRDLMDILLNFEPDPNGDWDVYSEPFSPENVMRKFREVFLD